VVFFIQTFKIAEKGRLLLYGNIWNLKNGSYELFKLQKVWLIISGKVAKP